MYYRCLYDSTIMEFCRKDTHCPNCGRERSATVVYDVDQRKHAVIEQQAFLPSVGWVALETRTEINGKKVKE